MPTSLELVVHSTHEAGWKIGGIGAVLDGLLSQPAYNAAVRRTILVGPYRHADPLERERLFAPRNGLTVRYSGAGDVFEVPPPVAQALAQVEREYGVHILYAARRFGAFTHEVLLVDPSAISPAAVDDLKFHLWQTYGIDSYAYEWSSEYEWYLRAAEPSRAALLALVASGDAAGAGAPPVLIAHDWLGLPLALSVRRHAGVFRLVYYAHEVSPARVLVEGHPGHDTRFYNVMAAARTRGLAFEEVFGRAPRSFKHALLLAASDFDGFFAVSELTRDELRFLDPAFERHPLALVYNGIPSPTLTLRDKRSSQARLRAYAVNLLGFKPDWVFTHVSRLVLSKALWRDLRVMEQLDRELAARGETAVLMVLATSAPAGKRSQDIARWEAEYGWPLYHRTGNGDLVDYEVDFDRARGLFNRTARASQIVFVNQFGFGPDRCGTRIPPGTEPDDLRRGTDLEFGQSIYEPFGIGQLEPLAAGALCCVSNVCGCVGFVRQAASGDVPNVLVADNVTLPAGDPPHEPDLPALLQIDQLQRDRIERQQAAALAPELAARLPRTTAERRRLLQSGQTLSRAMAWRVVVEQGLLPALAGLERG